MSPWANQFNSPTRGGSGRARLPVLTALILTKKGNPIYIYIYMVGHFEPPTLISHMSLYIFFIYGLWLLKDCGSLYIHDISLTHIRHLTPFLPQNLKIMVLWVFILIYCLTLSMVSNVRLWFTLGRFRHYRTSLLECLYMNPC